MELDLNKLKITVTQITDTNRILNMARATVNKEPIDKAPSSKFLTEMFYAEHSPIRELLFEVRMENVPSWVATHFIRHHVGSQPYVSTNRKDRVGYKGTRNDQSQGALVTCVLTLNAQAIIDVSKLRLCTRASEETRYVWTRVIEQIHNLVPELAEVCVPTCVYRGFCPESKSCGYINSNIGKTWRANYASRRIR